jgi:hypothetical protein
MCGHQALTKNSQEEWHKEAYRRAHKEACGELGLSGEMLENR